MKSTVKNLRDRELFETFLEMNGSDIYKGYMWDDDEIVDIPLKMGFKYFNEEDFISNGMLKEVEKPFEDINMFVYFSANSSGYVMGEDEHYDEHPTLDFLSDVLKDIPDGKYKLKISLEKVD